MNDGPPDEKDKAADEKSRASVKEAIGKIIGDRNVESEGAAEKEEASKRQRQAKQDQTKGKS